MARVQFHCYEELNDFLPPEQRRVTTEYEFDRRTSVKDMIEALGVPHPEIELIVVNGESVGFDYIVRDGDHVAVYPVFEALDVSAALGIRREPLRDPRFMLDANLGTLARYLRLCGFDSRYRNDIDDTTLARTAAEHGRILLTRDRDVLKRSIVTHGYFVRPDDPRNQLADVFRRFDLHDAARPFTRCSACNGELVDADRESLRHRLEPLTEEHYELPPMYRLRPDLLARQPRPRHRAAARRPTLRTSSRTLSRDPRPAVPRSCHAQVSSSRSGSP